MVVIGKFLVALSMLLLTGTAVVAKDAVAQPLALKGVDVVSYFSTGGPVKGKPAFSLDFDGERYRFVSAQNRAAFVADPDKYLPQFSGLCATGLGAGKAFKGDPNVWEIVDGKLYLHYSAEVKAKGEQHPNTLQRSREAWQARSK